MKLEDFKHKIFTLEALKTWVHREQASGNTLVFTNGCFDLIHSGHIQLLQDAAQLGDRLIVGINSDASVSKLKGENRPIKNEKNRTEIIAALGMVDAVILFSEETPLKVIQTIQPNVLCKGGDWTVDQIVGGQEVIESGGIVKSLPFLPGHSTTALEKKIKQEK